MSVRMFRSVAVFGLALLAGGTAALLRAAPPSGQGSGVESPGKPPLVFPCPQLEKLDGFTGTWNVVEVHFDGLGQAVATVKGTEVVTWQLEQRLLRRVYTTGSEGARFQAIGLMTWDEAAKQYAAYWFDNRSLHGAAVSRGDWQAEGGSLVLTLEVPAADGSKTKYQVIERFEDHDRRVATTYQVSGKDLTKRLEVRYERAGPCPSQQTMRVITYPENE